MLLKLGESVVDATRIACGLLTTLLALAPWPAWGQRVRMPSALPLNTATETAPGSFGGTPLTTPTTTGYAGSVYAPAGTTYAPAATGAASTYVQAPAPAAGGVYAPPNTYGIPNTLPPPGASLPAGSYTATPPGRYIQSPSPVSEAGPSAAFQGNIQPAPGWDPYGLPGAQQPTLLPQDPYLPSAPAIAAPGGTIATMTKFLQEIRLDAVYIPGNASNELGLDAFDLNATFAIPFLYNTQTPLLVTPGFSMELWSGPKTLPGAPGFLPPRTYDPYLDLAWNPQISQVVGGELGFRVGVFSDFEKVTADSLRFQGHGLLVLSLSPNVQVKGGIVYLDRIRTKLLPAGGIIWTPTPDARFEILFPNPRIARRLWTYGNTDWWLYVRGEYGGGSWTIHQSDTLPGAPADLASYTDRFDYNDIRVGVGLEFDTPRNWKGLFEVGGTFNREVLFRSEIPPTFRPDPTVYLRAALAF